jgi:DNA-binding transcriptional regulator LsrR (DeoR family)
MLISPWRTKMSRDIPQSAVIFRCAWLYYVGGSTQGEIAEKLGVSRASVALYLQKAREHGLVRIQMDSTFFSDHFLAQALKTGLNLDGVYVVPSLGEDNARDVVGATWHVLEPMLSDTTYLGVAWGEALYRFGEEIPRSNYPTLEVVQLCGNMGGTPFGTRPDTSTFTIARQLGAEPRNMYAPMILSSPSAAASLMKEAVIVEHVDTMNKCEIAVFSPGTCNMDSHIVTSGGITAPEIAALRKKGARAVICGRLIQENGKPLGQFNKRVVAISLDNLLQISRRVMICSGIDKIEAAEAAIRGGYATHLVVDEAIARHLVDSFSLKMPSAG